MLCLEVPFTESRYGLKCFGGLSALILLLLLLLPLAQAGGFGCSYPPDLDNLRLYENTEKRIPILLYNQETEDLRPTFSKEGLGSIGVVLPENVRIDGGEEKKVFVKLVPSAPATFEGKVLIRLPADRKAKENNIVATVSSGATIEIAGRVGEDHAPPSTPQLLSPSGLTEGKAVHFSWKKSRDTESGIQAYGVFVDGKLLAKVGPETTSYSANLSEGKHSWHVKAIDRSGNETTSSPMEFEVELVGVLEVIKLEVSKTEVRAGENIRAFVQVKNVGGGKLHRFIEPKLGGRVIGKKEVTISPGSTKVLTFEFSPEESGTLSLTVDNVSEKVTVRGPEGGPPVTIITGILAAVVVGCLLWYYVSRSRKQSERR